jgi:hypothetical protein
MKRVCNMFRLVFTHNDDDNIIDFDCILEATDYGDEKGMPCAIVSHNGILVKVFMGDTWITFH